MELRINSERLQESLTELGQIGTFQSEYKGISGVCRLALSKEDADARCLVIGWMKRENLEVSIDQIGNIYASRPGRDNTLSPTMSGSHLDSVPTGGRFDGALGVLGALEVVRTLNDHDIVTRRPLTIAVFTDEEGCRFATDMLGSAVATGRIPLADAWSLCDPDGISVKSELARTGFLGDEQVGQRRPHAFIECHVEQGPVLRHEGYDLGVVTGVQGISWQRLTIIGSPAHAGTTPTGFRRDAGLAAAKINIRMREMCLSGNYGSDMRATMGVVLPEPGSINVIPGRVVATVDLRNPDDEAMVAAETDLREFLKEIADTDGVEMDTVQTARTPAVAFNAATQATIASVADTLALRHRPILAGAGHDAQEWSRVCPTAMIFVPGENDGISHNPMEFSTPEQCANGINVLLNSILTLAEEPT